MEPSVHTSLFKNYRIAQQTLRISRTSVWISFLLFSTLVQGQTWTSQVSGTTQQLNAVWGLNPSYVLAVGNTNTVLLNNGTTWAPFSSAPTSTAIRGVWGTDIGSIWAVGTQSIVGRIWKYDGVSWQILNTNVGVGYLGIWGIDNAHIWVASTTEIRYYNGATWTIQIPLVGFKSIWGYNDSNIWAVGAGGIIYRFNGMTWTSQASPTPLDLLGVWGTDPSNVWAVGANGTILKFNGSSWAIDFLGTTAQLNGIWGTDANNVWAVGNGGVILKYNGSSWSQQTSPTINNLTGIGGVGSNIWITGASGTILFGSTVLPVELTGFQARLQPDQTALLQWQTASERNNAGFDIERSHDGKTWANIGFVAGYGSTTEKQSYEFKDADISSGSNYYRLVQKDFDGKTQYSDIRNVVLKDPHASGLHIFPNPVVEGHVSIHVADEPDENASVSIYATNGQLLLHERVTSSIYQANLDGWQPGIYVVEVKNAGTILHDQVIVR